MTIRPPTPPGWSDTDWLKHLEEVTPAKRHHYDMTEAIEIIAKLRAERDALAAELDDHCQQLRKEQLEVQSLHEKLAEQTGLVKTTWEQLEHRQRINDDLLAKLEELEAHTKTLTQAAYAARLERDVAWQRCKELAAQEPVAYLQTLRSNGYQEVDMRPASNTDMWINEPLYKRGTP